MDGEEAAARKKEALQKERVDHLMGLALRRLAKRELARGWIKWACVIAEARRIQKKALMRFRSQALFAAFKAWRARHRPQPLMAEEVQTALAELEAKLAAAKEAHETTIAAHEATKAEMAKRGDLSVSGLDQAQQAVAHLNAFVRELQAVIQAAYQANSWKECKHQLYHERLRYVSTAATHGRGSSPRRESPSQLRRSSQELEKRLTGSLRSGRLAASDIHVNGKLAKTQSMLELGWNWHSSLRAASSSGEHILRSVQMQAAQRTSSAGRNDPTLWHHSYHRAMERQQWM